MGSEIPLCDRCNHGFSSKLLPNPTETALLASLLRSNCEPSDPSHYHAVIASSPAELARFDEEIRRLQSILHQAQTARTALQFHYDACRSVVSAVHRLPSEILCNIFALIPASYYINHDIETEEKLEKDEIRHVSQAHLIRIACVCARWHGVIMGTPALWSNMTLDLGAVCWRSHKHRMMNLLKSVLDRGSNILLAVHITDMDHLWSTPSDPLKLLAQYSHRWRDVTLVISLHDSGWSAVQGQLPLLETLSITGRCRNVLLDLFGHAPRLTRLTVFGPSSALSTFPLKQLQHFSHLEVPTRDLDASLSLMSGLSSTATFLLELDMKGPSLSLSFALPPVIAKIGAFIIKFNHSPRVQYNVRDLLANIFDSVTIDLQELIVLSSFPLSLPQQQSLAFFSRSSLNHSLKVLDVQDVVITEGALVQCLGELPALEQLAIADVLDVANLLTASLFHRLTWAADPSCLVPQLNFLKCRTSSLQFMSRTFFAFVRSRLTPGKIPERPFKFTLLCTNHDDSLDQLWELHDQKELVFSHINPWEDERPAW